MTAHILAVSGSTRSNGRTRALIDLAADTAREAGAAVKVLDLATHRLPLFVSGGADQDALEEVREVRRLAEWAEGFLLATPEHHGGMSGTLKNWFDFLYRELEGKLAGVMAATGGGCGDMSITATKNSFHWCHGFTLPFHAAARDADFEGVRLQSEVVADRVRRVAYDVVRYAPILRRAFEEARTLGPGVAAGFAGHEA